MRNVFHKTAILIGFAAMLFALVSCGGGQESSQSVAEDVTITYAMQSAWNTLVPYDFSGSSGYYGLLVWDKIFDKLVYVRSNGEYSPRAAKSWDFSEDKTVLTLQLDENALWHDGEKVTAEDWVWTAQLLSGGEFTVPDGPAFSVLIAGTDDAGLELSENSIQVVALDDYTLQITFKQAMSLDSFFMTYMHYFSVLPKHLLQDIPESQLLEDDFWTHPIGSGPTTFVSEIAGSEITLASFPEYHLGAPEFDTLVIKVLSSSNFVSSFMTGEIDYAYPSLSTEEAQALQGLENMSVEPAEFATELWFIAINNSQLSDPLVKQAMNLAIDKELIVQQLFLGEAEAVESVQIPGGKWYDTSLSGGRDLDAAKALLDAAGWDYDSEITLATPSGVRLQIANILQQNFAEIGLKLNVESLDIGAMFGGLNRGLYPMGLVGGNASFDPMWINSNLDYRKGTFFNVTDPTYVNLADAITLASDEDAKLALVYEYQQYMAQQMPLIPIVMQYPYAVKTARLGNMNPLDSARSNDAVWEWDVK